MKKKNIIKVLNHVNTNKKLYTNLNELQINDLAREIHQSKPFDKQLTEPLEVGDRVIVTKGKFKGKEAVFIEDNGANYFAKIQIVGSEIVVHINPKRLKKIEPKELSFEEVKAKFPIGSKAKVINSKGHSFEINTIVKIVSASCNRFICEDVNNKSQYIMPCDLEPIQEPKTFKVGDFVQSNVIGSDVSSKGIICEIRQSNTDCDVYYFGRGVVFTMLENLKHLPNE